MVSPVRAELVARRKLFYADRAAEYDFDSIAAGRVLCRAPDHLTSRRAGKRAAVREPSDEAVPKS